MSGVKYNLNDNNIKFEINDYKNENKNKIFQKN